jgi:hypothetical protein
MAIVASSVRSLATAGGLVYVLARRIPIGKTTVGTARVHHDPKVERNDDCAGHAGTGTDPFGAESQNISDPSFLLRVVPPRP